ncbi:DUF1932 domain-containing protein [Litorilinea aerophila]|uniref:NAD(P)-dependent oxidoreductase n=1 Tax=Litorilinea aerophila TaxID=1204385 RepID=A0A540VKF3_9CHLR|nr:NAD(P)-dependent oxidoreductase [Litorilinea aerophila]MCC9075330.1 DUF1932 domain-containing protein [Litorilinea aerophila]
MSQPLPTVAILSPGDMGHAVGRVLREHGLPVITCLQGRSPRTRNLAAQAGIAPVDSYEELVQQADLLLSILVPAQALTAARQVAEALQRTGADLLYVDCNAISPETVRRLGQEVEQAGARFVDASIIGPPPREPGATRFYASGPHADEFAVLQNFGLDVRVIGETVGHASALKMCYAALTKGLTALSTELLVAAQALGVWPALRQEFEASQPAMLQRMNRSLPGMPAKAYRWVGEMEEIAATFEQVGLTPRMLLGAADMYRLVEQTPLARLTPEDPQPTLEEMLQILSEHLSQVVGSTSG